jgi:hypothetical protein
MNNYISKRTLLVIHVIINTVIFSLLSILHFYWAFGGRVWYDDVLPTNSKGTNRMNPGTVAGFIVALGLLVFALITADNLGIFDKYARRRYFRYGALIIAIIFFVRAIGDFKFIGFFKTVNQTRFGINDTQIFSPLCLFIALLSTMIFVFNRSSHNGIGK